VELNAHRGAISTQTRTPGHHAWARNRRAVSRYSLVDLSTADHHRFHPRDEALRRARRKMFAREFCVRIRVNDPRSSSVANTIGIQAP
jgi:hypothetical protein